MSTKPWIQLVLFAVASLVGGTRAAGEPPAADDFAIVIYDEAVLARVISLQNADRIGAWLKVDGWAVTDPLPRPLAIVRDGRLLAIFEALPRPPGTTLDGKAIIRWVGVDPRIKEIAAGDLVTTFVLARKARMTPTDSARAIPVDPSTSLCLAFGHPYRRLDLDRPFLGIGGVCISPLSTCGTFASFDHCVTLSHRVEGRRCLVEEVLPGSPADRMGLRAQAEIVSFNGILSPCWSDLEAATSAARSGDPIRIRVRLETRELQGTFEPFRRALPDWISSAPPGWERLTVTAEGYARNRPGGGVEHAVRILIARPGGVFRFGEAKPVLFVQDRPVHRPVLRNRGAALCFDIGARAELPEVATLYLEYSHSGRFSVGTRLPPLHRDDSSGR